MIGEHKYDQYYNALFLFYCRNANRMVDVDEYISIYLLHDVINSILILGIREYVERVVNGID